MAITVVAEKPSVARDLARVLGARRKADGFLEGNGYRVTWAIGHLVHYAEPDEYGAVAGVNWAGRWVLGQLPMIPDAWKLKTTQQTASQFKVVKALITAPDTERVVCATDAGREGEHIFRLIYQHARCNKPFDRLWISSLTDEAIREGFRALRPGRAYDHLADAARARAQADWLIGMNLTRAYTLHNRVLCTIGRVQTPTLAMIVARDQAIASFTKALFYELVAHLRTSDAARFDARYLHDGETRIEKKEEAERLHRELSSHRTGRVAKVEKKIRTVRPPPLYDLTNLQRDANRRFGFTAAQVLEHAQALYETHKLISYPRTESRHIAEDMLPELPGILKGLQHPLAAEALDRLQGGHRLGKAYVDRTKLTDHHAILPTGKTPSLDLPPALRKIYDLVVTRFVAVFLPDQRIEETRVEITIGDATFLARGAVVLEPGWKRAEAAGRAQRQGEPETAAAPEPDQGDTADATSDSGVLPPLVQGQELAVDSLEVQEKETQPPRHYDDSTLLAAMKNAGREIEDDALAAAMKQSGLGTPATRAEIIEKLIRTRYVERRRKQLLATTKGIALIGLVAPALRSPELTAGWEQRLKDIEHGELPVEVFDREIVAFLRELVPRIAQGPAMSPEQVVVERAERPVRKGGTTGRAGGTRKARRTSRVSDAAESNASQAASLGACPICHEGEVTENARAYGCSRYREGCGFTIWKRVAGLTLTQDQVSRLIAQGHLPRLEGFTSKAGKPFAAGLRLDAAGKVVFDFEATPTDAGSAESTSEGGQGARKATGSRRGRSMASVTPEQAKGRRAPPPSIRDQPPVCPKCGQGKIIEGRRGFGCNRFREGCDFVVWKTYKGLELEEADIRELIEHGRTRLIATYGGAKGPLRLWLDSGYLVVVDSTEDASDAP
ncbi:DNA topoisomerase III [Thiocapsa imhoffii]|uniref:DNA topoisomerase n=1 Tax=Thiocapsa imhoffii TaxID=382777 RepID=A0A9X0WKK4_9GAMM|nr:type IA DNA topoisomerase [Thiocapsa imhoffii]MBK1646456.1 DNA topoisomerase III [Thiocapsa imhoffii]